MVSMVGPSYQAEEGVCIPQYADIEKNLKRLSEFQPRNTDYIFCSYPKSGTHWVYEIIRMLVSGLLNYTADPIYNLESGNYADSDGPKESSSPRVLHTHLPPDMLPKSITERKMVYILRDPRDQLVSLYHHHQGLKWSPKMSFTDFFKNVQDYPEKVEYGNWFRNPYQWWVNYRGRDNVLFVFYEDLINDIHFQITRIAQFYGLEVTPSLVSQIAKKTKFAEMKYQKPVGDWFSLWHKGSFSIYRNGRIGNWVDYFTPEMNHAFNEFFKENTIRGCEYPMRCPLLTDCVSLKQPSPDNSETIMECQQEVAMAH
ncbi:sulfotransferase 1E1-like [Watersipora subatra]|uniref:sulfotransferase 1E1-like n=1 Tax=Watersipora subatra TaxID=2589382 RepID=UPI00355C0754